MVKTIVILVYISCLYIFCYGDNQQDLDSLLLQFQLTNSESVRNKTFKQIEEITNSQEADVALAVWKSLYNYCEKNDLYQHTGKSLLNLAIILRNDGKFFESYKLFQKCLNKFDRINSKRGLAKAHNGLGILYKEINKFDLSGKHYFESAKFYEEIKDTVWVGLIYLNIGSLFEKQNVLDSANLYLKKSEQILLEKNDTSNVLNCYINLGLVSTKTNNYKKAYNYFLTSYKLSNKYGNEIDKFNSRLYLGDFLYKQERFDEAESLLFDAIQYYNKNTLSDIPVDNRAVFTNLINEIYFQKGDFKNAYLYLKKSTDYEVESKIIQSEMDFSKLKFETELIKADNQKKKLNIILYFTLAGLFVSILLILTFYWNYRNKQRANSLLTEMDQLKTKLYSNITHELRTPLTLILGPLEQMLSSDSKKQPSRKQVKMMRKNANSLLNLVNQMLDLAKVDANSLKLELTETNIVKFIRIRFAAFASLANQKKITYSYNYPDEKIIKIFDANKLEKIINNLVSNAIKFTQKNGTITCEVSFSKNNQLKLAVRDSGKGIPENERDKIFDRFQQVGRSENYNKIGTGLGLSLTKELVELMHGKIMVESELNKGTTFIVIIPLGTNHLRKEEYTMVHQYIMKEKKWDIPDETEYETQKECATFNSISENETPVVLVVEDHTEIREFIGENIRDCYRVLYAGNGTTGFEQAAEHIPDLIVSDVLMPETDGFKMCEKIKTDERTSHIPVILLTAKSADKDILKGLEIGADAYVTKPFKMKELRIRIKNLIEQRRKLRERFKQNLNLDPKEIAVTSADEKFINRAMEIIEQNISNTEFEVRQLQEEMYMSRMQLFRKIKALTNQTPGEFIRTYRLKRAARLMDQNFGNIAQVTFEVGFNNPSYFAKCFKDLYGKLPSEYIKNRIAKHK